MRAVDPQQTLFALDLDGVAWSENEWHRLLRGYPYGLEYLGSANTDLQVKDQRMQEWTHCLTDQVRGDWLVQALLNSGQELSPEVRKLAAGYADSPLDLAAVAAELGLADPALVEDTIRKTPHLAEMKGLPPLMEGQTIPRRVLEEKKRRLFQDLAVELKLGTGL